MTSLVANTAEEKRTPTPWKVIGKQTIRAVNDATDYDLIAKTHWNNGEANAAHIVHCVNSFDALTEANKKLVLALERARDDLDHLAFNIVREDGEAMTQEGAGNFAQRSYERVCDAIKGAK